VTTGHLEIAINAKREETATGEVEGIVMLELF
jgi:hypothetical protein